MHPPHLCAYIFFFLFATLHSLSSGQEPVSRQKTIHNGRISRSFTEPSQQTVAASAETGIITEVFVKEGDRIERGTPLAKLNDSVLQQALKIAEARADSTARLDAAKSQLEIVGSQLAAVEKLVGGGHTNKFEVEQKRSKYSSALAEFKSAEDELKLNRLEVGRIRAQINDRIIISPIDGVVTELHKEIGESIGNTEPTYATIVKINQLKVRFYQDAKVLKQIRKGQQVQLTVGGKRSEVTAAVLFVSPIIDPESGLGRIDLLVENQDRNLQSGVLCEWVKILHSND